MIFILLNIFITELYLILRKIYNRMIWIVINVTSSKIQSINMISTRFSFNLIDLNFKSREISSPSKEVYKEKSKLSLPGLKSMRLKEKGTIVIVCNNFHDYNCSILYAFIFNYDIHFILIFVWLFCNIHV